MLERLTRHTVHVHIIEIYIELNMLRRRSLRTWKPNRPGTAASSLDALRRDPEARGAQRRG